MSRTPDEGNTRQNQETELPSRRIFVGGEVWRVHEVQAPAFDRRGGTHLIFENFEVMRRVRTFPSDWMRLSDEELYALSLDLRRS